MIYHVQYGIRATRGSFSFVLDTVIFYTVPSQELTCITFSNGWRNLSATNGIWAQSNNVVVDYDCTPEGGNCGHFNSSVGSTMTIPYFANAMDAFTEFSISMWFQRMSSMPGKMGLVGNGDCGSQSSLFVVSEEENVVSAMLTNSTGSEYVAAGIDVSREWQRYISLVNRSVGERKLISRDMLTLVDQYGFDLVIQRSVLP